ncbi:MAG: hypothetical protein SPI53_04895 [Erysipelotrichaceae bacterium]|nr:hypothetical protein [Erysipelotrichaceae bacterium]
MIKKIVTITVYFLILYIGNYMILINHSGLNDITNIIFLNNYVFNNYQLSKVDFILMSSFIFLLLFWIMILFKNINENHSFLGMIYYRKNFKDIKKMIVLNDLKEVGKYFIIFSTLFLVSYLIFVLSLKLSINFNNLETLIIYLLKYFLLIFTVTIIYEYMSNLINNKNGIIILTVSLVFITIFDNIFYTNLITFSESFIKELLLFVIYMIISLIISLIFIYKKRKGDLYD